MATKKVLLQEDTTGKLPDNLIVDEVYQSGTGRDRLIVPEYGAFFENDFVIKDNTGAVVDRSKYFFVDMYEDASLRSAASVWNAVIITDPSVSKEVKITYQGFGGKFAANGRILIEWVNQILDEAVDPIEWSNLKGKPFEYNPAWHMHLWSEVYGYTYIKNALTNIENAIDIDSSIFFRMLIKSIQDKLEEANKQAARLAETYAKNAIYEATKDISKETLNLHLIANLTTASPEEMREIGKSNFDGSTITTNKYINKKGLIAFTESLKARSVSIASTNIGIPNGVIKESKKGSLISLANSGVIILESKNAVAASGHMYEENCYPKNYPDGDRFTITRITHNLTDHGGAFLGFNNTTGEMFTGVMKDDKCFRRIQWWKFYSEITYDKLIDALNEHIRATNNPHDLKKEQVSLEKVWNFPVVTEEEILTEQSEANAYVTLDMLQLFMTKHLLNLKGELKEDGTLNKDTDPFNKPNLIFTPCDKKVPENFPPLGQILKLYCEGTDRIKRVADGKGGYTDDIFELNSDDCNYFEMPKQGTVLSEACDSQNLVHEIADGRGGSTKVVVETSSEKCGYKPPLAVGTILREGCDGLNFIRYYADGNGGEIMMTQEVNSEKCGFTTTTTTTTTLAPTTNAPAGVPRITLRTSHSRIEVGTRETISATFTGFSPNSVVSFTFQNKEPRGTIDNGAWSDWRNMLDGTVQIDGSGSGSWSHEVTDNGVVPRETSWDCRIQTSDGLNSNTIVRTFVSVGGAATNPPVVTTTPPPANNSISVSLTNTETGVSFDRVSGQMTVKVVGNPVTSYYYQIYYQPEWYGLSNSDTLRNKWFEVHNGVVPTNSGGAGQMNIPNGQIFGLHLAGSGNGSVRYNFKAIVNETASSVIQVSYWNTSQGGGL